MINHQILFDPIRSSLSSELATTLLAEEVAQRAYTKWTGRSQSGHELQDWLDAESDLAGGIELLRTQELLKEQLRLTAFGRDIGLAMCQDDNLANTLGRCCEAMVRHLEGAFARIWTLDETANVLELKASAGLYTHIDGRHSRVAVGQFKIGLIAQERKPYLTNAVFADPLVHDHDWARREGMVAFAGYPLLVEDRLVGVMAMFAHQPLSEVTLDAMASVANGVAVGIERKRTQERLREQLMDSEEAKRRLVAEHSVSSILLAGESLTDATPKLLQAIGECFYWDVGAVWLVDRDTNLLRCVDFWQSPLVDVPTFEHDTRLRTFSRGIGMPGRVWASNTFLWVADVTTDTNFPRSPSAAKDGLFGAICFPISNGVEFIGIVEFFSREIRQPDNQMTEMMTSIANQIGQFIERRLAERQLHRQEDERHIAREIQRGLLPKTTPRLPGFEISGKSLSPNLVGGDCFDFFHLPKADRNTLGVFVGDASGHGIGAALLTGQTRAYLHGVALTGTDVGLLLDLTNECLSANLISDHFVTAFLMILDSTTRSLSYTSAGHLPGYILDPHGQVRAMLPSTGFPLGVDTTSKFPTCTVSLEPNDLILLVTDGITEAASPEDELFGMNRALQIVRQHLQKTPQEILTALFASVSDFCHNNSLDDLTAVIIKVDGNA